MEVGKQVAGNGYRLSQNGRLEHEDIVASCSKPLVVGHVFPRGELKPDILAVAVGHRIGRVADEFAEALCCCGRLVSQLPIGGEKEFASLSGCRWPFRKGVPATGTRIVKTGFDVRTRTFSLEEMPKEGRFDLILVLDGCLSVEGHVTDPPEAGSASPIAVPPGPHDNRVVHRGVIFFQLPVDIQRSVKILSIKQSANDQHIGRDILEMREDRAALPELVVVGVLGNLLPKKVVASKILAGVLQWAEVHVELPTITRRRRDFGVPPFLGGSGVLITKGWDGEEIAE